MKWEKLKEAFSDFHAGKITKKFLIGLIREYQFTNQIEVLNGSIHNKGIFTK